MNMFWHVWGMYAMSDDKNLKCKKCGYELFTMTHDKSFIPGKGYSKKINYYFRCDNCRTSQYYMDNENSKMVLNWN